MGKHDVHTFIWSAFVEDLGLCEMHFVIPEKESRLR